MAKHVTTARSGSKMNPILKNRVIHVLIDPENDGLSQNALAEKLNIATKTLRNYMTAELLDYVRQQRLQHSLRMLAAVDQAMLEKASRGDVAAAKLVYSRWEEQQHSLPAKPSVEDDILPDDEEELDALINKLMTQLREVADENT